MVSIIEHALSRDALIVGSVLIALGTVGLIARRNLVHAAMSIGVMAAGVVLGLGASGMSGGESRDLFAVTALLWCPVPTALLTALVVRRMRRPIGRRTHDDDRPADMNADAEIELKDTL
ncbi:MAG: NADH-quinone oxidoreductase subunit K [Planctomycetaceae bacterium]